MLQLTCPVRIPDVVSNKNRLGRAFTRVRYVGEDLAELLDTILDIDRFATKDVYNG